MNPFIQLKKATPPFLFVFVVACFALFPTAEAVVPAPDGGYPGGNTAEGQNALFNLTTGGFNTAVGWFSLFSNVDNRFNTAVGAGTLLANTADGNTATGAGALLSNTTGENNTANGTFALLSNTTSFSNTAIGAGALYNNSLGGNENTANGFQALFSNTSGGGNAANGFQALFNNTTGILNTANGYRALCSNTSGGENTANGFEALENNTTGSGNTALGVGAGSGVTTANNVIVIGAGGADVSNSCFIGNIFGATVSAGTAVFINASGHLGTTTSSRRFKKEIKLMDKSSEAIHALKPVTFRYKKGIDPQGVPQFGLVAEEVEAVNPDLVVHDKEGKPYSVRYDQVNAMLLNEFLKEHRTVQELKREIAALTATVKEQAAQIQKVSAKIEMNERASQTVAER
jgi:trimeric autotransporter adhesin